MIHKGKAGCFAQRSASWAADKYPHPVAGARREARANSTTEAVPWLLRGLRVGATF
jgi:hypothetical protein